MFPFNIPTIRQHVFVGASVATTPPTKNAVTVGNNGTNVIIPKPPGVVEGVLMVAYVVYDNAGNPDEPSGWTVITEGVPASQTSNHQLCYKVATDSEPVEYEWDRPAGLASLSRGGNIIALRNLDVTDLTNFDVDSGQFPEETGPFYIPSLTSEEGGSCLLAFTGIDFFTSEDPSQETITTTSPLTMAAQHADRGLASYYVSKIEQGIAFEEQLPAGVISGRQFVEPAGGSYPSEWITVGLILKPKPQI